MDDTQIIALYMKRNEKAIEKTAEKYGSYLNHIAYNILRCHEDTEEVLEDTYFGAWNTIPPQIPKVPKLGNILRPDYVTRRFNQILKDTSLRKIRFHDLRHTFASILLGKDVPLINVSDFLGHSTISTTANIYAHLDKASKQASADVMAEVLSSSK